MSTYQSLQNKIMSFFGTNDSEFRTEVKEAINDIIAEINDEIPNAKHTQESTTFTCTADSSTVTSGIPSDYDHVSSVLLTVNSKDERPLIYLDYQEWRQRRLYDLGSDIPTHYTIWDSVLYVGPPSNSAYPGKIDYYKFDSALTDNSDTGLLTDFAERWERIIVQGVKSKMYEFLATDQQMIERSFAKYQNDIKRFRAWNRRNFNKSPDASRVRGWKEVYSNYNPLLPEPLRR